MCVPESEGACVLVLIWSDPVKPPAGRLTGFIFSGPFSVPAGAARRKRSGPERSAAVKGAPLFGAAKRTLDCEHRSGRGDTFDGGSGANTFLLVGLELVLFGTAGPITAEEHTRRLITLIFAGRNRMDMIRRELPRTRRAGWVRKPFRIEHEEDSPFRGLCAVIGSAVQKSMKSF